LKIENVVVFIAEPELRFKMLSLLLMMMMIFYSQNSN